MHNSPQTKAIRQRMEEVRCDLDEDVQEIVESARGLGEWRSYVRTYPWVCLGTALAAGYLIVPRRHIGAQPDAQTLAELASQSGLLAMPHVPRKRDARSILLAFAGNLLLRGVSSYVGQQAVKSIAARAANSRRNDQP